MGETQTFVKNGTHTNQAVLDAPDEDRGLKQIDCNYTFDLVKKTSTFKRISTGFEPVVLPISEIIKEGSQYIIKLSSYGDIDASFTYAVKIYLDVENNTMLYTKYDPYMDRSFVHRTGKLKISVE